MRKVVIGITGAVALLLAGMLAGNAEAAPLTGCCHVAGAWLCGSPPVLRQCRRQLRGVASCTVNGIVPALRHHIRVTTIGRRLRSACGLHRK